MQIVLHRYDSQFVPRNPPGHLQVVALKDVPPFGQVIVDLLHDKNCPSIFTQDPRCIVVSPIHQDIMSI